MGAEAVATGGLAILAPLLRARVPPLVVSFEWFPRFPATLLAEAFALLDEAGYGDLSHSGYACDERWFLATHAVRRRGGVPPEELAALRQPTWCTLPRAARAAIRDRSSPAVPETILAINDRAGTQWHTLFDR